MSPKYYSAKYKVMTAALRVASHNYDREDDPGWQAEMDDEMLDEAVVEMAEEIRKTKEASNEPG